VARAAEEAPLAVCLPTLPLPPVAFTPGRQASAFDLALRERLSTFATQAAQQGGVRIVNPQRLDTRSPLPQRRDVKSELAFGFPYRLPHVDVVAELLASLMRMAAPMKGLITDLDGTLWKDIVGEVGAQGVSWDLEHKSQIHGLYQQMLLALADAGVLVAVASKNDPKPVDEAFEREDLILPRDRVFPIEVHWGPKSESVSRILRAWNIGPDSVVFVDDSPMELGEVKAAHPDVTCLRFPGDDEQAAYELLEHLRELFGKDRLTEEDALRRESLRQSAMLQDEIATNGADTDEFLQGVDARLTLKFPAGSPPARALELINKTNQFNLNGRRLSESEWRAHLSEPDRFLMIASYEDKYGALGAIAVLTGRARHGGTVFIDTWVMSCRAFARRIEFQCLDALFAKFGAPEIAFDFRPTPRNGPTQELFTALMGELPEPGFRLSRRQFADRCPRLFQTVRVEDAATERESD
jgi:FkbH-like protein